MSDERVPCGGCGLPGCGLPVTPDVVVLLAAGGCFVDDEPREERELGESGS